MRGVLRRLPISGVFLLLGFFAITGSPLFGPFVSEYQILSEAFATDQFWLGMAYLVLLLLVFFGMGNTLINCSLGPAPQTSGPTRFRDNFGMVAPIAFCMLLTFILGVYNPPFLTEWIDSAAKFLQRVPNVA